MGTAVVTSVGFRSEWPGWAVPLSVYSVSLAVGTVAPKPWAVEGHVEVREVLHAALDIDHDVMDGAPAARFVATLAQLFGSAHGLDSMGSPELGEPGDAEASASPGRAG